MSWPRPPINDLSGQTFGRITVIRPTPRREYGHVVFEVRCKCGKLKDAAGNMLKAGRIQSCGCSRRKKELGE